MGKYGDSNTKPFDAQFLQAVIHEELFLKHPQITRILTKAEHRGIKFQLFKTFDKKEIRTHANLCVIP